MSENPYTSPKYNSDTLGQKKRTRAWITVLAVFGIGALLVGLLLPAVRTARPAARRNQCINNLKQIGLALRAYESVHHALPPAYTVDANGKPLHSWRTLILPYLEEQQLYEMIDLSKPWDDPANAEAFNTEIWEYRCAEEDGPPNHTTYLAVVASNGCFRLSEPRPLSEITDGLSRTLMVIEVPSEQSVHWMSPKDADEQVVMELGQNSQLPHGEVANALFADGHVIPLTAELPAAQRRAMISVAGDDNIAEDDK